MVGHYQFALLLRCDEHRLSVRWWNTHYYEIHNCHAIVRREKVLTIGKSYIEPKCEMLDQCLLSGPLLVDICPTKRRWQRQRQWQTQTQTQWQMLAQCPLDPGWYLSGPILFVYQAVCTPPTSKSCKINWLQLLGFEMMSESWQNWNRNSPFLSWVWQRGGSYPSNISRSPRDTDLLHWVMFCTNVKAFALQHAGDQDYFGNV